MSAKNGMSRKADIVWLFQNPWIDGVPERRDESLRFCAPPVSRDAGREFPLRFTDVLGSRGGFVRTCRHERGNEYGYRGQSTQHAHASRTGIARSVTDWCFKPDNGGFL